MALTPEQITHFESIKLSPHFSAWEAIRSREHPLLIEIPHQIILSECKKFANDVLEPYREQCCGGETVRINSWYRNYNLNKAVGGEPHSTHQVFLKDARSQFGLFLGVAADTVPSVSIFDAFRKTAMADIPNLKTVILYPKRNFIHLDSRVSKSERTWLVSMGGKTYTNVPMEDVETIEDFLWANFKFKVPKT